MHQRRRGRRRGQCVVFRQSPLAVIAGKIPAELPLFPERRWRQPTQRLPRPWETGPDSLRLPRYLIVMRALLSLLEGAGERAPLPAVEMARGLGLNLADLATDAAGELSNNDEEEGTMSLDTRIATRSV